MSIYDPNYTNYDHSHTNYEHSYDNYALKEPKNNGYKPTRNNTSRINIITLYPGFSYKNSQGETIVPQNSVLL